MVDGRLYNPKITWPAARGADSTTAAFVARLPRGGSPPEVVLYVKHTRVHEARRVAGTVVVAFLLEEIIYDVLRAPKLLVAHLAEAEQFATSVDVDPDVVEHAAPTLGAVLEGTLGVVLEGLPGFEGSFSAIMFAAIAIPEEMVGRWTRRRPRPRPDGDHAICRRRRATAFGATHEIAAGKDDRRGRCSSRATAERGRRTVVAVIRIGHGKSIFDNRGTLARANSLRLRFHRAGVILVAAALLRRSASPPSFAMG